MKIFISAILLFLLFSCGKSPLLNEDNSVKGKIEANAAKQFFVTTEQLVSTSWLTNLNTFEEGNTLIYFHKDNKISDPNDYEVSAKLWMRSMGHGSSPIIINKISTGIYQLSEIFFTMTGDWQLQISLSKDGKIIETKEFEYTIVE